MKNLIFALAFLSVPYWATAQAIESAPSCPGGTQLEFIKHIPSGTGFLTFTITSNIVPPTYTWEYFLGAGNCGSVFSSPTLGVPIPLGGNLQATFNATQVIISRSGSLVEGERLLTIKCNNRVKTYRFVVRDPLQMIMVLDRSGSMECDIDEVASGATWPGCATGNTAGDATDDVRWHALRDAIDAFVNKLDTHHKVTGDEMGIVYFAGNTAVQGLLTNDGDELAPIGVFQLPMVANPLDLGGPMVTPIVAEMNTNPPGGAPLARDGTSLGEGMYKAIVERFNNAEDASKRQVILLFTDGEQNTGKWFDGTGKIIQNSQSDLATALNTTNTSIDAIEIYSAGVINVSAAELLLQNIADNHTPANPSYFSVMPGAVSGFENEMAGNAFNEIYNDFSPQFVRFDKHILAYNSSVQSDFDVNKNVSRVIFEAYFDAPLAKDAQYKVLHNGVDVTTQASKIHVNDHIATIIYNSYELPNLPSEGKWTFVVSNTDDKFSKNTVALYATADDHHVEFDGYLDNGRLHVGQTLKANVAVSAAGQPITDAIVTATIIKPGEDLGMILATTNISNLPPKSLEIGTCGAQKLDYLETNNKAALAQWKNLQQRTITLTHQGKGVYSGTYNDVDVTGNYKIIYHLKGNSPVSGTIERTEDQTIHVRFAPINVNLSSKTTKTSKDGIYYHTLNFRPGYKAPDGKTRYIGPGYEGMFKVQGARLVAVGDQCDGNYDLVVSSPNRNPNVRIQVADDQIYSGRINQFDEPFIRRKWNISAHAGTTNPSGTLDSTYNSSLAAELDLAYRFSNRFSGELVGGYYSFNPSFSILGGTAYAKAHLNTNNPLQVFIGLGGGIYKPTNTDLTTGISLRLGAERFFNERFSLGIDVAGFSLPDADMNFGIICGSLRYKL